MPCLLKVMTIHGEVARIVLAKVNPVLVPNGPELLFVQLK